MMPGFFIISRRSGTCTDSGEFPDGCASYPLHRRILTGSDLMKCDDRISEKRYNDFMKSEAGGNIQENCDY